jgi:hypothetical protein
MQKKQKELPPINAEYTEMRRKALYSANLGVFGEARRIIFPDLAAAPPPACKIGRKILIM